ncbi:MAG: DUF488 family protein [Dermatophilus congolensis]|nr:DUF488 family protein [Dermatophilus congolensis]
MKVTIARAYDLGGKDRTTRVLVDRVWPRGIKKADLHVDEWLKDIAPSTELRKWFAHDPEKYEEFARRYRAELAEGEPHEALQHLRSLHNHHDITLVYSAKDEQHNQARVLAEILEGD